jgi:hypothetical protein
MLTTPYDLNAGIAPKLFKSKLLLEQMPGTNAIYGAGTLHPGFLPRPSGKNPRFPVASRAVDFDQDVQCFHRQSRAGRFE